jgi:glutamyl-tRNA reductase
VSGPLLDRIVSEAMAMARQAHRIATHDAPSMADLAVGRVLQHLDGRQAGPVGLVGVSPMTRRCGLMLRERKVPITIINRTLDTAQELATELGRHRGVAAGVPPGSARAGLFGAGVCQRCDRGGD